jgi:uncharacterized protein YrrD
MELEPTAFQPGEDVITAAGDKVGILDRVVIDPRTGRITDIVVRRGFLLVTDKVVPVGLVQSATRDRIILLPIANFDTLPDFETSNYVTADQWNVTTSEVIPIYWNPPIGTTAGYPFFIEPYDRVEVEKNIPQGTIALKEGAKVYNADGQHVGDVVRVFYDPETNQMTHILMQHGLLTKEKKLIPANWIMKIFPERVDLAVGSQVIDQVKAYQE